MNRLLSFALACTLGLSGAEVLAHPPETFPNDSRLAPLKDLDGYFPFAPFPTAEAWQSRAAALQVQIRVTLGLWPEPTRTPLNAVIHGRVDREEYTVEKVFFESMPGFFVTGNLYRPKSSGNSRTFPAVLCPHGHWPDGRFMDASDKEAQQAIASGAERFEDAAHSPLQARCVQLARAGCVVFHYDMLGYADSTQLSLQLVHKFARQRPEMNASENWGLFSPQAESHAQSVLGLQIWNGMRAIDFMSSLPDVDASRIGVTGASGGATQTMLLSAIDPRITVAFPAVMVSTAMQGGCTCENASLLRIGTGNVEFAALFAPKPMGMTAADDWTKEMPGKGFPELQRHWSMLGAPDNIQLTPLLQFPHNYNSVSRAAMIKWFNRHLGLALTDAQLDERDFHRLTKEELSVWDAAHPAPDGGLDFERKLLRWWHADAQAQILKSPEEFKRIAGPAIAHIIGRTAADDRPEDHGVKFIVSLSAHGITWGAISNAGRREEVRAAILTPEKWNGHVVLWLSPHGKSALFTDASESATVTEVQTLLDAGASVVGLDLFEQGGFYLAKGEPPSEQRIVENPRESAAFTFGYNPALFAQRTQDVLTAIQFVRDAFAFLPDPNDASKGLLPPVISLGTATKRRIDIVSSGAMGPVAAAARAVAGDSVAAAVIDSAGFRFGSVADYRSPNFLPAVAKYGDFPGLLALAAPQPAFVLGEPGPLPLPGDAYRAAHAESTLRLDASGDRAAALEWLKETFREPVTP